MEPVRFGLVGYGFGGRYFHAPLLAAAPGCALLGVVSTSAERREHPAAAVFGSLAQLRDAGAEAVAISTPADTHTALTCPACLAGAVARSQPVVVGSPHGRQRRPTDRA